MLSKLLGYYWIEAFENCSSQTVDVYIYIQYKTKTWRIREHQSSASLSLCVFDVGTVFVSSLWIWNGEILAESMGARERENFHHIYKERIESNEHYSRVINQLKLMWLIGICVFMSIYIFFFIIPFCLLFLSFFT